MPGPIPVPCPTCHGPRHSFKVMMTPHVPWGLVWLCVFVFQLPMREALLKLQRFSYEGLNYIVHLTSSIEHCCMTSLKFDVCYILKAWIVLIQRTVPGCIFMSRIQAREPTNTKVNVSALPACTHVWWWCQPMQTATWAWQILCRSTFTGRIAAWNDVPCFV